MQSGIDYVLNHKSEPDDPVNLARNSYLELTKLSKLQLLVEISELSNPYWYMTVARVEAKASNSNSSSSSSPFNDLILTTSLPPSEALHVPSDQNNDIRTWPSDPKVQAEVNKQIEENLKRWHEEQDKEREILVWGKFMPEIQMLISN